MSSCPSDPSIPEFYHHSNWDANSDSIKSESGKSGSGLGIVRVNKSRMVIDHPVDREKEIIDPANDVGLENNTQVGGKNLL